MASHLRVTRSLFRSFNTAPRPLRVLVTTRALSNKNLTANRSSAIPRRFYASAAAAEQQPRLRLGSTAPNFRAKTTKGEIDFHEFINGSWAILFSHPADFTPVCTTELGAFAKLAPEFEKRGVKMIGLSANELRDHDKWIADINDISRTNVQFPIVADADRKVAYLYDMLDEQDVGKKDEIAFTIRSVFIIDPAKKIRLIMLYPASTGRNAAEVLRVIDALQHGDARGVSTPINWQMGDDVIVPPSVSTAEAKAKFKQVREVRPYLRFTDGELRQDS